MQNYIRYNDIEILQIFLELKLCIRIYDIYNKKFEPMLKVYDF